MINYFISLLKHFNLPIPETEYQFCKDRKWRFDYAFVKEKIAVEQEGGAWNNGRHTRPGGFIKDMEKYNTAVLMGWRILRYTPEQMDGKAISDLQLIFKEKVIHI